ncbi:fructose-1,6-bisphosphatase [Actinosynnema sp. ALI-1.44]|uniref:fructose-1,6-bisphosphatase n=1 Tax=Actinosynnema sp. ALI-1.44 TaxID=1933779 RepID=UPI0011773F88|nr:fructose-1,6-bisphosphatase [Actinosynnema sp. ALI-1.44]
MGRELTPEERRRRIDEIFGDVMPETTKDERQAEPDDKRDDDWYLSNKPPHHG